MRTSICKEASGKYYINAVSRIFPVVVGIACLGACYFVNQPAFESSIKKKVSIGMPMATATKNLKAIGLTCNEGNPADCSRVRQRLWPSSCIERVNISVSNNNTVEQLDIRPILCAGL
jgi:hypothetical protein